MPAAGLDHRTTLCDSERRTIEAASRGDGLAFRRLVERHLPMLLRVALRVAGNRAIAEDAVQETLTLSYQRLVSYRHEASFKTFLAAIAARQAHTMVRAERRRAKREQGAAAPGLSATPEQELQAAAAARRVRAALAVMPRTQREAALLRLDAGLSHREIAAALDSTEGSVRVLVYRALKQLRERLACSDAT